MAYFFLGYGVYCSILSNQIITNLTISDDDADADDDDDDDDDELMMILMLLIRVMM